MRGTGVADGDDMRVFQQRHRRMHDQFVAIARKSDQHAACAGGGRDQNVGGMAIGVAMQPRFRRKRRQHCVEQRVAVRHARHPGRARGLAWRQSQITRVWSRFGRRRTNIHPTIHLAHHVQCKRARRRRARWLPAPPPRRLAAPVTRAAVLPKVAVRMDSCRTGVNGGDNLPDEVKQ